MSDVRVHLLGGFELLIKNIKVPVKAKKTRALIAWLVMHPGKPQSREMLAHLLWQDKSSTQSRQNLRQCVADLKKALGETSEQLESTMESIRLPNVQSDVADFERLASSDSESELEQAIALYQGAFCDQLESKSETFDDWVTTEQRCYSDTAISILQKLVDAYRHSNIDHALKYAHEILRLDPYLESTHRRVMELYRESGRIQDAIAQYQTCEKLLANELGLKPELDTWQLYQEIISNRKNLETVEQNLPESPASSKQTSQRQIAVLALQATNLITLAEEYDDEQLLELVAQNLGTLETEITANNGEIIRRTDNGLVAAFGLRKLSGHELEQCIRCAVELKKKSREPLTFGYALSAGQSIVTLADKQVEITGAILNRTTSLLKYVETSDIVVPRATLNSISKVVEHSPVEASSQDLVRIHHISNELLKTPFSGRQLQLRQLQTALDICKDSGLGQTILIRGEAGLGKTRLVQELVQHAYDDGCLVGYANVTDQGDGSVSNLTRLVTALLDFDLNVTLDSLEPRQIERIGMNEGQRSALIDLLDLKMPEELRSYWDSMSDQKRQQTRRDGLEAIISNSTSKKPVLTIIEDIHWAEYSLLARIGMLSAVIAEFPTLLVLTTRNDESTDDLSWRGTAHSAPFSTMDLGPLREKEALELGRHMVEDEQLLQLCIERSAGHPLFLEQLIRSNSGEDQIPNSIQAIIQSNLYTLPGRELDAIQAAAVLGQEFTLDALRHMLDDHDYVPTQLLVQRLISQLENSYMFGHSMIRETTYGTMVKSRRTQLHLKAAEFFKKINSVVHADHLMRAESGEASTALLEIARQEQKSYRHDRARVSVKKGLKVVSDEATRRAFEELELQLKDSNSGWSEMSN